MRPGPVAGTLRAAPAFLDGAHEDLRRRQTIEGSRSVTLAEWQNILTRPAAQVRTRRSG